MFNNLPESGYLSKLPHPMMIDVAIFPMLERVVMLEGGPWHQGFELLKVKEKFPSIYSYVHRMREYPSFKPYRLDHTHYGNWLKKCEQMELGKKHQLDIDMIE